MSSLDIKQHQLNLVSIKDLDHDVDISESKWNNMFDTLTMDCEAFYFYSSRLNFMDDEYQPLLTSLADETLIDDNGSYWRVLCRLKPIALMFNRKQLAKLWQYYEHPALIVLKHERDEVTLVAKCKTKCHYDEIINAIDGSAVMYQGMELDVVWIKTS